MEIFKTSNIRGASWESKQVFATRTPHTIRKLGHVTLIDPFLDSVIYLFDVFEWPR